jgi:hypothetical protein
MVVSDTALSRGAIAIRSRWSDRQRSVPPAAGPAGHSTSDFGSEGAHRAAPRLISYNWDGHGVGGFAKVSRLQLALSSPSHKSVLARLWRLCRRHNPEVVSPRQPSALWRLRRRHNPEIVSQPPRLSLSQYIRLWVLPASAVLTRATPSSLAWVATPLAPARSLPPPGPQVAHNIKQGRALGAVLT